MSNRNGLQARWDAFPRVVMMAALSIGYAGLANAQSRPDASSDTDQLIVRYIVEPTGAAQQQGSQLNSNVRAAQNVTRRRGVGTQYARRGALGVHVLKLDRRLPVAEVEAIARELASSDANIAYVEPDRIKQIALTPTDPRYAEQWHYYEATAGLNLPPAWDISTGTGITVAVLDTGHRPHVDLVANVIGGYDFISNVGMSNDGDGRDANAQDPGDGCGGQKSSWHGTHVAGTVAAVTNNGIGVSGVAFNARVISARVLGCGGGYDSDIADAIQWASGGAVPGVPANASPARVLNLSFGGASVCGISFQNAITAARSRNAVVVAAAGNSNANAASFSPANCAGVVVVAAVNRSGGKAWYSNYGSIVDVAAPGGTTATTSDPNGVLSTLDLGFSLPAGDGYALYQGTSMAAPHVAGVVALMQAHNPALTPNQVEDVLRQSARAFPQACTGCGTGMVNAFAALTTTPTTSMGAIVVSNSYPSIFETRTDGNLWNNYFSLQGSWVWANQGKPTGVSLTGSMGSMVVGGGYPSVFATGSDGNLWNNYFSLQGSWVWANQGKPSGVSLVNSMGAVPVSGGYPHVFATGSDGNLWANAWNGSTWVWGNIGKPNGASIGDSMGTVLVNGGLPYVFATGSNGALWVNHWTGSAWVWANLGWPPGVVKIASSMGAVVVSGTRPYVFVTGSDGNLWLNYLNGSGSAWIWADMSKPAGVSIERSIGSVLVDGSRPYTFVTGSDGNLWVHYWSGSAWLWGNLEKPAGVNIVESRGAITVSNGYPSVFVKGSDGNLWNRYWNGASWTWANNLQAP